MFGNRNTVDTRRSNAYNHVLKYTGLFGGVQCITVVLSIIRNKFVAVLLDTIGMSLIDIFSHALTLISSTTAFGIPTTAVRTLSELYQQGDEEGFRAFVKVLRSWSSLAAIIGFLLCSLFSPLVSKFSFDNYHYTLQFILLSPIVAMVILTSVEAAILKALRKLKTIALVTFFTAVGGVVLSVPLYFLFGLSGIVPALLLTTFASLVIQLRSTLPLYPWHASPFSRQVLSRGRDMIRLSLSFILAGIVASAAEMLVRAFIVHNGSLAEEGLYGSGVILTVTYARFVFVAMDNDFYPRLSAVCHDVTRMNETINRQMEVCVLLIAPFLILFVLFLPFIIHLLFTPKFLAVIPMTICATFYMFFKAVTTPVAYCSLAHGDSFLYFTMEFFYYLVFVLLVAFFYSYWGLTGAGVALSLSNLFDMLMICIVFHYRYHYVMSSRAVRITLLQGIMVGVGVIMASEGILILKYGIGLAAFAASAVITWKILSRDSTFTTSLKDYLHRKFTKKEAK